MKAYLFKLMAVLIITLASGYNIKINRLCIGWWPRKCPIFENNSLFPWPQLIVHYFQILDTCEAINVFKLHPFIKLCF